MRQLVCAMACVVLAGTGMGCGGSSEKAPVATKIQEAPKDKPFQMKMGGTGEQPNK